jgi:hypothetical protein
VPISTDSEEKIKTINAQKENLELLDEEILPKN